jgi:hypothetical protein
MSYPESRPSSPTEAEDALFVAVVAVCEKSFLTFVESCDHARFEELVKHLDAGDTDWLMATVKFSGSANSGWLDVVLPDRLARSLVGSLLGAAPDAELPDAQIFDGIGEFTNMICGAWLTDLSDSPAFELGAPEVSRLPHGWNATSDFKGHQLSVNDLPLELRIRYAAN